MNAFLWLLYQGGLALALLAAGPFLLARRGRHYLPVLAGRWGGAPTQAGPPHEGGPLWLHAVSVGEVSVAATLARALPVEVPLLVTTVTPTGQELARRLFAGRATVAYLPFDLGPAVQRFWRRFAPAALVLIEGDYWPLVLRQAARRGAPVAVVNGRVGDRSYGRLRRVRPLAARLFAGVGHFGMQTDGDRQRLLDLGVPAERVAVTGNLKFDTAAPAAKAEVATAVRRWAAGRPILVAGSTMKGEDEQVIEAFQRLGAGRRALLLIAPRHPERWDEVEGQLRQAGLRVVRRSQLGAERAGAPDGADAVLLDSMGDLSALYAVAAAAFIGGTMVPTGGHNPLEPARFAVPTAVGPSMYNFREIAEAFDRAGAWQRVEDAAGLARAWDAWLTDPVGAAEQGRRGAELLRQKGGALARTVEMLQPMLSGLRVDSANPGPLAK